MHYRERSEDVIRSAKASDASEVAKIFAHYVDETVVTFETIAPSPREWAARIESGAENGYPFLVAETERTVVGYAFAGPWRTKPAYGFTVEDSVYLAPGSQGSGLGRALLSELLDRCDDAGFMTVVAVIADTGSSASATLHRSMGFEDVGVLKRVGFKHDRWIDTLLMQRRRGDAVAEP